MRMRTTSGLTVRVMGLSRRSVHCFKMMGKVRLLTFYHGFHRRMNALCSCLIYLCLFHGHIIDEIHGHPPHFKGVTSCSIGWKHYSNLSPLYLFLMFKTKKLKDFTSHCKYFTKRPIPPTQTFIFAQCNFILVHTYMLFLNINSFIK